MNMLSRIAVSWDDVDLQELAECADALLHEGDAFRTHFTLIHLLSFVTVVETFCLMWDLLNIVLGVSPTAAFIV